MLNWDSDQVKKIIKCVETNLVVELVLLFNDTHTVKEAVGECGDKDEEEDERAQEEDARHCGARRSPEDGPTAQSQQDEFDRQWALLKLQWNEQVVKTIKSLKIEVEKSS